jgi:hypothetical protein
LWCDAEFDFRLRAVFPLLERGDVTQVAEPRIARERRERIEHDQPALRRQRPVGQGRERHRRRIAVAIQATLREEAAFAIEQRHFQAREFQGLVAVVGEQQVEVQVLRVACAFDERVRRQRGCGGRGGQGRGGEEQGQQPQAHGGLPSRGLPQGDTPARPAVAGDATFQPRPADDSHWPV